MAASFRASRWGRNIGSRGRANRDKDKARLSLYYGNTRLFKLGVVNQLDRMNKTSQYMYFER